MPNWKKLIVSGSDASLNTLNIQAALTASGLNYPDTDGSAGQAITTDGTGNLSFTTISGGGSTDTGSLLATASAAGSTITFEKGDGSTFDVTVSATATPANALVTASLAGSTLTFEKGNASTFDIILPAGGYSGSNATAHLNQTVSATTWSFAHNLDDRYPVFTIFDDNGDIIVPNRVETVDNNNANIYFTTGRTGTATAVIASSISQISSITSNFTNQTTVAVTHSLDTRNIHVSVYDDNYALVIPESITLDTLDTVVVTFPTAKSGTVVVAKGGHIISGSAATAVTATTASYVEYVNVANKPTLISGSAQIASDISGSFTDLSSSLEGRVSNLEDFSSSLDATFATDEDLNIVSSSVDSLNAATSSYALKTEITGSFTSLSSSIGSDIEDIIDGTTTVTSASYALSALSSSYAITSSYSENFNATGSITINGYTLPLTDGVDGQAIITDGDGVLTFDDIKVYTQVKNISGTTLVKGTPVHATASASPPSGNVSEVIAASASLGSAMPATFVLDEDIANDTEGRAIAVGYIKGVNTTGFTVGDVVYVGPSGGYTNIKPTGSDLIQNLGVVTRVDSTNGAGFIYGSGRSNDVPNILEGYAWVGNSNQVATATATSSFFVTSGSHALNADTSSYVDFDNIDNKPTLLSGSAQIAEDISGSFTDLSSSLASELLKNTTDTLDGDLTVTGTVTAQEFHTEYISSSIIYESGSTQFGDSADDTHIFSGSVNVDGAVTADSYTGIFEGALSSSAQIASDISGSFTDLSSSFEGRISSNEGSVSSLNSATSSYALKNEISGSFTDLSSSLEGRIAANESFSSSLDTTLLTLSGSFSGSFIGDGSQLSGVTSYTDADTLSYINTLGVVSGSEQIDLGSAAGTASHAVSSSFTLTASYAENAGAGAGFPFEGDAVITGSLLVSGSNVDFTNATSISGSSFSGSFIGDGSGLTGVSISTLSSVRDTFTNQIQVVVNHNFGSKNINVAVYDSSDRLIMPDTITLTDDDNVTVDFAVTSSGAVVVSQGGHLISGSIPWSQIGSIPSGIVSSSAQIASDISGSFTSLSSSLEGRISANETFSSSLDTTELVLSGSFSGSFIGDGSQLSGVTSYTDSDTLTYINSLGVVSGSEQIDLGSTEGTASHAVSSSYSVTASYAANVPETSSYALSALSSSYALTASYADSGAGFPYSGDAVITGSFLVSGSFVDLTDATVISGSTFSGSFVGDGTGLSGLGYGDTKKLEQTSAATTWSFSHNMNEQFPTVTVYNDSNEVIQPTKIEGVDAQTLKLYFGVPTAGTAVAVVGGTATTQEAGFNRVLSQASAATTWSFAHNLGNKYPQVIVYDSNDEFVLPGKVEAVDQNNLNIYFDTAQSGTATATVGGTSLTASYADSLVVSDTLLTTGENTDVDTGTETVATVSTTFYDGAFFDYVAKDGTNYRAGTVMAVWDGSSVQYADNSTADIGDTSGVTLAVDISGTDARLRATVTSDNWNIKAFVRAL